MRVSFVQLGLGGVLEHVVVDVPATGARWDDDPAPTVTLRSGSGSEIRASQAATLGVSTSTAATVTAGGRTITVLSAVAFDRWEEVVVGPNAAGQWEWATVDGLSAGASSATLTVLDDLAYGYAPGCPVRSHRMKTTLSAADVGDVQHRAWAEWAYTVDGIDRKDTTLYIASRHAPRLSLTGSELLGEDPRLRRLLGSNQRLDLMIRRTWERKVLPTIAAMWEPGSLVSGEAAEEVLILAVRLRVYRDARDYEAAEQLEKIYRAALDRLQDSAIDLDEDGAIEEEVRGSQTARLLRG